VGYVGAESVRRELMELLCPLRLSEGKVDSAMGRERWNGAAVRQVPSGDIEKPDADLGRGILRFAHIL
jgi:hypothetical protein